MTIIEKSCKQNFGVFASTSIFNDGKMKNGCVSEHIYSVFTTNRGSSDQNITANRMTG